METIKKEINFKKSLSFFMTNLYIVYTFLKLHRSVLRFVMREEFSICI